MTPEREKTQFGSWVRLRFSLRAVLAVIALISVALAWWQLGHLKRQRLLIRQRVLNQLIDVNNELIKDKWEIYVAIAKDSGRFDLGEDGSLREIALQEFDRLSVEILRLENQTLTDEVTSEKGHESKLENRIVQLQKLRDGLRESLQRTSEPSVELEMLKHEIERLQRKVDDLSRELTPVEVELQIRAGR